MKEYDFKNEHKDVLSELKTYIFNGHYELIQQWLEKHDIGKNENNTNSLVSAINNNYHYNFFVFSVVPYLKPEKIDGKIVTSKQLVQMAEEKRVNSILTHLDLNNQLRLLMGQREDLEISYVKNLKLNNADEKEKFAQSHEMNRYMTKLFHNKNFDMIEEIEKLTGLNLLINAYNDSYLHYKEKNGNGSFSIINSKKDKNIQFKPYYDIIFNFDMDKHDFLVIKKIDLPTWKQAQEIADNMLAVRSTYLKETGYNENGTFVEKIHTGLENYKKNTFYYELQDKIPLQTQAQKKSLKI